jgi:hypothetical protein
MIFMSRHAMVKKNLHVLKREALYHSSDSIILPSVSVRNRIQAVAIPVTEGDGPVKLFLLS